MKKPDKVSGVRAIGPRPTRGAAFLLATALSIPVFVILNLIAWGLGYPAN